MKRTKFELMVYGVAAIFVIIIITIGLSALDDDFIRNCQNNGYSYNYCKSRS